MNQKFEIEIAQADGLVIEVAEAGDRRFAIREDGNTAVRDNAIPARMSDQAFISDCIANNEWLRGLLHDGAVRFTGVEFRPDIAPGIFSVEEIQVLEPPVVIAEDACKTVRGSGIEIVKGSADALLGERREFFPFG